MGPSSLHGQLLGPNAPNTDPAPRQQVKKKSRTRASGTINDGTQKLVEPKLKSKKLMEHTPEVTAATARTVQYLPWPSDDTTTQASWSQVLPKDLIFLEIFAGDATLSQAVRGRGVPTLLPDEVIHGGTNFLSKKDIEN